MPSKFQQAVEDLEALHCSLCKGIGILNDAAPGDTYCNNWTCSRCEGTGFDPDKLKTPRKPKPAVALPVFVYFDC